MFSVSDLGCYVDVIHLLDKPCSDKPSCEYIVGNQDLLRTKPCASDSNPYLEVDYECVTSKWSSVLMLLISCLVLLKFYILACFLVVANAAHLGVCSINLPSKLRESYGYISAQIVPERGVGSFGCPLRIEALPGQSVSVTLISLGILSTQHTCKSLR